MKFACPFCHNNIDVPTHWGGNEIICPHVGCAKPIVVPNSNPSSQPQTHITTEATQASSFRNEGSAKQIQNDTTIMLAALWQRVRFSFGGRSTRIDSLSQLAELGESAGVIHSLASALSDRDPRARKTAAFCLARIGSESAVEVLISNLDDVNGNAIKALASIQSPRVVELLIGKLYDSHMGFYSSKALVEIGNTMDVSTNDWTNSAPLIVKALEYVFVSPQLTQYGVSAAGRILANLDQRLAIETLLSVARNRHLWISTRKEAVLELSRINDSVAQSISAELELSFLVAELVSAIISLPDNVNLIYHSEASAAISQSHALAAKILSTLEKECYTVEMADLQKIIELPQRQYSNTQTVWEGGCGVGTTEYQDCLDFPQLRQLARQEMLRRDPAFRV